jgi:hypothetical protein
MTVRLFARGSDGLVAITSGGVTQAVLTEYLNKPKKNISNVFFALLPRIKVQNFHLSGGWKHNSG